MEFKWQVNEQSGSASIGQITRIIVPVNNTVITRAEAEVKIAPSEAMFFNGYQTWTWCPEYTVNDYTPRITVKKELVDKFGFDRYGDYHFQKYPTEKGQFFGYSYCYFRDGNQFRLFASLDESNGYTVFEYDSHKSLLKIKKDVIGVEVSSSFRFLDLYYREGTEDEVFDGWFAAMNIHPKTTEKMAGYSSWYNRYENISEAAILEDLEGCAKILQAGDLFQVDDGWEVTVGEWVEDRNKFPAGLKPVVETIHQKGYKAGLWLAPFVVTEKSTVYKEHQDWLLRYHGKPWYNGSNWGGFYSLDLENPEVREHLRQVFDTVFNVWGFDLVKLDFLYAGAPWPTHTKSRGQLMCEQMDFIAELCEGRQVLGCGVPLMPCFGKIEYCRIGCDVSLDWDDKIFMRGAHRERVSTKHAIDNTFYRRQLNGRAFLNDPDVFFLRDDNLKLTKTQKEALYDINALLGGVLLTSDNPGAYDEAKVEQYREIRHLMDRKIISVRDNVIKFQLDGKTYNFRLPYVQKK